MGLELKSLTSGELLGVVARQLGLTHIDGVSDELSSALIAAVLRRIAATTCPCPREVFVEGAVDAFTGVGETEATKLHVREVLDSLVILGDLLELGGSTSLPGVAAENWLYCAPPAFVVRGETVLLLGIEPEDQAALPASLRGQLVRQRELRYLRRKGDDGIAKQLRAAGYLEISKAAWTRLPQNQSANTFFEGVVRRLRESGGQGALEGLQVYGAADEARPYTSRLTTPAGRSGYYVGRRPQAFGSPIWVFVELDRGRPVQFLDLPWRGGRFRGCDHGWRIQSALDVRAGKPQTYRVVPLEGDLHRYEFFSPVPLWVERKLRIEGEKVRANGALFAYELDRRSGHGIDELVQSYMWFTQAG
ncbi:hypothetical protein [Cognatiluteimonas lumbrici]|uniref:hypothetical protein n=1 Tax=Cognatiluteimonas lumbrici TaxID=2559601 RepID=UPI0015E2AEDC|nr:hypothetical protein [Luteimonas lumbrici]